MANFYLDNEDLRFYVEKYFDWESLVRLTEYGYKTQDGFKDAKEALDFYKSILELIGEFSAEEVAPRSKELDRDHPKLQGGDVLFPKALEDIFGKLKEMSLHGLCLPRELGGMNAPLVVFFLVSELLARSDVSVCAHNSFHGGVAMCMLLFSAMEGTTEFDKKNVAIKRTRFEEAIREIGAGEAWGSMDITEAGAGSDMAALLTKGEQDEQGNWTVTGEKIFITSGNAKYHFVIGRTEKVTEGDEFSGLKGLSMFLVPCWKEDGQGKRVYLATFASLEDKLGHHGSATVVISYDRTPALLIGKRGEGFKYMLQLMNNARVGVGFESLGICEAAFRLAKAYADERPSMGRVIAKHEMIADYLDEMKSDVQAIRALGVLSAHHEEMNQKYRLALQFMPPEDEGERRKMEKDMKRHQQRSRHLTPLLKYLAAEKAVEHSRRCVQIHGGVGYSTEYGAEKLLRDSIVLPIYEGTSQIQSLMVMKDNLMGIVKNPRAFLRKSTQAHWRSSFADTLLERRVAKLQVLGNAALRFLITRLLGGKLSELTKRSPSNWREVMKSWNPKRDFALAMLHAERLTRILADVAVCDELLEQGKRFPERCKVLESYLERAEPRCQYLYQQITTTGARLLSSLAEDVSLAAGAKSSPAAST